jgi:hypothetical protein
LRSAEELILLDSDYSVTACTLNSFALLGIQPETLETAEKPRISEWVSNWPGALVTMAGGATARLRVREAQAQHQHEGTGTAPGTARENTISGRLQCVTLPGGIVIYVLYWRRDALAIAAASLIDVTDAVRAVVSVASADAGSARSDGCSVGSAGKAPTNDEPSDLLRFTAVTEAKERGGSSNAVSRDTATDIDRSLPQSRSESGAEILGGRGAGTAVRPSRRRHEYNALQPALHQPTLDHRARTRSAGGPSGARFPAPHPRLSAPPPLQAIVLNLDSSVNDTEGADGLLSVPSSVRAGAANSLVANESLGSPTPGAVVALVAPYASRGVIHAPNDRLTRSAQKPVVGTRGDDERGSYASSRASEAAARVQDRIRRVVNVDGTSGSTTLLPSLRLLRNLALIVAFIVAALATGLAGYLDSLLSTSRAAFDGLELAIAEVRSLDAISQQTQALQLCILRWGPCSGESEAGFRSELLRVAASLSDGHVKLEASALASGIQAAYRDENVAVVYPSLDPLSGSLTVFTALESLFVAVFTVKVRGRGGEEGRVQAQGRFYGRQGIVTRTNATYKLLLSIPFDLKARAAELAVTPLVNLTQNNKALRFLLENIGSGRPVSSAANRSLLAWAGVERAKAAEEV